MRYLDVIGQGARKRLSMAFNIFSLEADYAQVTDAESADFARGPPRSCVKLRTGFRHLLDDWGEFLKARGR